MIIINTTKVFIQTEPKITMAPNQEVRIKHIASVFSTDSKKENEIMELKVYHIPHNKTNDVIPALKIINVIHKYDQNIDLRLIGNTEILVNIQKEKDERTIFIIIKTILVCFILFLGAGLAIINFHADVNMGESLQIVYHMLTGEENHKPLILLIPYSLGIGAGMSVFFNHIFQKKWKKEPSPLEMEMFLYEKNMDDFILDSTKHN